MPIPTEEHIQQLGPPTIPFRRWSEDREPLDGEAILFETYDATDDGMPVNVVEVNPESRLIDEDYGKYLWVIDNNGMRIILEATQNPDSDRGVVCHSNITAGEMALQGGELWFGTDGKVYINFSSGRYGAQTEEHEQAVINYFHFVGYAEVEIVD